MYNPFASHIGLSISQAGDGACRAELTAAPEHLNPHDVVHGAVLFAMADTAMGSALYSTLDRATEWCTTVEIKINYFRPAGPGLLVCDTQLVNRGRTMANLDSRITQNGKLVAAANGNFAILQRQPKPAP